MARTGRPKLNRDIVKSKRVTLRVSNEDIAMLDYCSKAAGIPKTEILRTGLRKMYKELSKEAKYEQG